MERKAEPAPKFTAELNRGLEQFGAQLRETLGERLVSILLYGGLAKGEFLPQSSDVNVLVVLKESTIEILDRIAPAIEQARRDFPLSLLLLTEQDLSAVAEVFSIKFLDIKRHHCLLWGEDVMVRLNLTEERLRRQCTREIINLQLRLRQFYLRGAHRPEQIERTLCEAVTSFLTMLAVLIEMKNRQSNTTKAEVAAAAAQIGLDPNPLQQLLALKRGELKPDAAGLKQLFSDFMRTVEAAARLAELA